MSVLTKSGRQLRRGLRQSPLQPAQRAQRARPRAGWHAYRPDSPDSPYRPDTAAEIPDWAVELALSIEFSSLADRCDGSISSALLLVRPRSRWQPLAESIGTAVAGAVAEVEALAGILTGAPPLRLAYADPLPGLEPVRALDVLAHLRQAGRRGCDDGIFPPQRPGSSIARWHAGAGAVLTCESPAGWSAQAVVMLDGHGDPRAVRPPGPGAVVLRARRADRTRGASAPAIEGRSSTRWALALCVVLAARSGRGLGRAARLYAADAERSGWCTTVLTGPSAVGHAIAGDPRNPFPTGATPTVGAGTLASLVNVCVAGAAAPVGPAARIFGEFGPTPVDNSPDPMAERYHWQTKANIGKPRLW